MKPRGECNRLVATIAGEDVWYNQEPPHLRCLIQPPEQVCVCVCVGHKFTNNRFKGWVTM